MKNRILKKFDFPFLFLVLALIVAGVFCIYSSGFNSSGVLVTNYWQKQIIWASIGFVFMIFFTLFDYRKTQNYAFYMFIGLCVLLIYTRIFGSVAKGAKSWIGIGDVGIQPSEFGKIVFILFLSKYFVEHQNTPDLKKFLTSLLILFIPLGLILLQPDLGTASVYLPIYIFICLLAGVKLKYLGYFLMVIFFGIIFAIIPIWNNTIPDKPYRFFIILSDMKYRFILTSAFAILSAVGIIILRYFHGANYIHWLTYFFSAITLGLALSFAVSLFIKEYQVLRLIVFLDPYKDGKNGRGAGWNIIQSKIAIGSGGLIGKGFLNGSQSHLRYLPEQHTDFIFGILSEEFGFFGGVIIFIIYFLIFLRILYLMRKCTNKYGIYIASGILGMFVFHFYTNVGMVMGIMPITGIPLLFLSYGGSSLLTSMICVGILMNINYRRKQFMSIDGDN